MLRARWKGSPDTGVPGGERREIDGEEEGWVGVDVDNNNVQTGAYEQRPFAAYGANDDRLVEIKTAYDPTNFFRHNQNIRPKDKAA